MEVTNARWLHCLSRRLSEVPGIGAIVLGGCRAAGTSRPHSDYDLGLYYEAERPLDIASLATTVRARSTPGLPRA